MKLVTLREELTSQPLASDFLQLEVPIPDCPENGILVRVVHLSLDPYIGSRLRGRHMGEAPPAPGKEPIPGAIVGQVVKSNALGISQGDWVQSMEGGWQEFAAFW